MKTLAASKLGKDDLIATYRLIKLGRRLDERLWQLNRIGKVAFHISGQGSEVAQAAMIKAFNTKRDYFLPYYRDMTAAMGWGVTAEQIMAGSLGKAADPSSHGRQMPNHYGSVAHRIVSFGSTVTTQYLLATGVAYAALLDHKDYVTLVTTGEGSTAQGDFHEALNIASIKKLPVVFAIENNGYAISTPNREEFAVKQLAERGKAYNMPAEAVDGHDFTATYQAFAKAVSRAEKGKGPTLIEVMVDRLTGHSSDDNQNVYRSKEEMAALKENDNVPLFEKQLSEEKILTPAEIANIDAEIKEMVNQATQAAEKLPAPAAETLLDHVYA
ncbi:thiamine pyrophosphate-dependent dehydrogenase E1 component subunit alpha [Loigolactobacillus rennini]|uniref:2-oxoisovalerate dehydrogenase subunit alpha n=1 Tax=Loigolactobacillus rennini DSM 20253 TaxID=1423796 RepID=A0A0R2D850_9LACO|nr:thiamine pyrophosphate-dependent dehydrogenase E1 component subunit alpha [Loigolactobacillus rennini]KRM99888.1 acetoin dehydrogenase complex [Loigolactobacillus rennini DSM 20253]